MRNIVGTVIIVDHCKKDTGWVLHKVALEGRPSILLHVHAYYCVSAEHSFSVTAMRSNPFFLIIRYVIVENKTKKHHCHEQLLYRMLYIQVAIVFVAIKP